MAKGASLFSSLRRLTVMASAAALLLLFFILSRTSFRHGPVSVVVIGGIDVRDLPEHRDADHVLNILRQIDRRVGERPQDHDDGGHHHTDDHADRGVEDGARGGLVRRYLRLVNDLDAAGLCDADDLGRRDLGEGSCDRQAKAGSVEVMTTSSSWVSVITDTETMPLRLLRDSDTSGPSSCSTASRIELLARILE